MRSDIVEKIAPLVDHTLLKPEATSRMIEKLCSEAVSFSFASVCVYPQFVSLCKQSLTGSTVKVCTVVGFPHGNHETKTKAFETELAKQQGAEEFDMVINISALKDKNYKLVESDIREVCKASDGLTTKVILETHLLDQDELRIGCELTQNAGAQFVKTSTGMTGGGATEKDIRFMRSIVGETFGVKASGGVRSVDDAMTMILAGANRIGSSSAAKFLNDESAVPAEGNY